MPIAIIVGVTGQDGTLLYKVLEGKKILCSWHREK